MAVDDPNDLYDDVMTTSLRGGILRFGVPGQYTYEVKEHFGNKPANSFSWLDAARFCNWLHNGKPSGDQAPNTTEDGAYDLSMAIHLVSRRAGARWFVPTEDEWYKAAYYDPHTAAADEGGSLDYWRYPTRSDVLPQHVLTDSVGDVTNAGENVANFERFANWNGTCVVPNPCGNVSTVGGAGATSPWGAFDMAGNIYEWTETPGNTIPGDPPLPTRIIRGGDFSNEGVLMSSTLGPALNMQVDAANIGLRVATVVSPPSADGDGDDDVDLDDFAAFLDCVSGPHGGAVSPCDTFDFDTDADIDWADYASFQAGFTGL